MTGAVPVVGMVAAFPLSCNHLPALPVPRRARVCQLSRLALAQGFTWWHYQGGSGAVPVVRLRDVLGSGADFWADCLTPGAGPAVEWNTPQPLLASGDRITMSCSDGVAEWLVGPAASVQLLSATAFAGAASASASPVPVPVKMDPQS